MKKNIFFIPINSKQNTNIFLFKICLFLKIIQYCLFEKCTIDNPFLINNNCAKSCKKEDIDSKLCVLDNAIIKKQYLNNIIYIKQDRLVYNDFVVSENNTLYYLISTYPASNFRIIYLLNNEGYGLLDKDNPIYNTTINDPDNRGRIESLTFLMKLSSNTDNNEYLISISKSNRYMEIYDLESNHIYFKYAETIFSDLINIDTITGTYLKLKNDVNTYVIGLLAIPNPQTTSFYHFFLKKGSFVSLDIEHNIPTFTTQKQACSNSKIVSCYETISNFIVCFYQNQLLKYIMIVYDYNLIEKTNTTIAEATEKEGYENLFFNCIHFFENTGVFAYFSDEENPIIIFKFKKYSDTNNLISDNYETVPQLSINNIIFTHNKVTLSVLIKIEDYKFYFAGMSIQQDILYIISIYNYNSDKFATRIYSIDFKNLYNYVMINSLKLTIYKNFLVLGSKNNNTSTRYPSLIIFSYPNTSEVNLDLVDYLYKNDDIKINDLRLNLTGDYIMENNLFGYIYSGIQIIKNCDDSNIYLADSDNQKVIDYFLSKDEEIKLIIPNKNQYSSFICKITYAVVVTEPEYYEFNNYPIIIINTGNENDEKTIFETKRKNYIGKYNYYNIMLPYDLNENNCEDNCVLCASNDISNCITCKYSAIFENNIKICYSPPITDKITNQDINIKTTLFIEESTEDSNIQTYGYIEECNIIDFFHDKCKIKNTDEKDNMIENIQKNIEKGSLDLLISNVIDGEKKDLIVKNYDTIYQITSTENQKNNKNNNISTIILGECENILKRIYNINPNLPLIILKVDYLKSDSLIPIIGYEIFNPENGTKLDLKYCKNEIVNFSIPVSIDENNLFKHDPNDDYYNDQCKPYTSESGTDILLTDRHDEYNNNNLAVCENNCKLSNYETDSKKVICQCEVKSKQIVISEIINQTDLLYYNFTSEDESTNTYIMKCYYVLFTKEGLYTNIANYILLFTIILFMISTFIFYKCGYHMLEAKIKEIILLKKEKDPKKTKKGKDNSSHKEKLKKSCKKKKKKNKKNNKNKNKVINHVNIKELQKSTSKIDFNYSKKKKLLNNKCVVNIVNKYKYNYNYNYNYNDYELNTMKYKDALQFDKRTFFTYYNSLIKTKHPIIFSFFPIKDYNSKIVKIDLFFLAFSINYFINSFFFNEKLIHTIYENDGNYNVFYFIPFVLYSLIISQLLMILIKQIFLSEKNINEIKNISTFKIINYVDKVKKCIIIKYIFFYILSLIFLLFFWYKLSSFGAVYQNTQISLIKNTIISFCFSLIYPFIINVIPGGIRIYSLKSPNRECFYKINFVVQLI